MLAPWAMEEMEQANLKDKRLNKRLSKILSDLGNRPNMSIPAACGGSSEMAAAYRFFANEKVTAEGILNSHYQRTRQRIAGEKIVLLVQDTTELDLTRPEQQVEGAGPLDNEARRGVFLHPLEAFTVDGVPLGAVWSKTWTRNEEELALPKEEKRRRRKAAPIEEKESFRWLEGMREARAVAESFPHVQCVTIADSEADIYELHAEPRGEGNRLHWIVRACQDRGVQSPESESATHLWESVQSSPVLFRKTITVRGRRAKTSCEDRTRRQPRKSRKAEVAVRARQVTLKSPGERNRGLPPVTVNVVYVREIHPPQDDEPVEWLLVTTLPIDDAEQVRKVVQYYCARWGIEVLFRTLKSGCRVEERRFEHVDRLLPCAAVYLIVAWRTLYVCRMGRDCPDMDCEAIFEPSEWKSVYVAMGKGTLPKKPPRLMEMVRCVAELGGYVNHPNRKDPPGPQTIWLGLQRMHDLAWAWDTFGPGAQVKR